MKKYFRYAALLLCTSLCLSACLGKAGAPDERVSSTAVPGEQTSMAADDTAMAPVESTSENEDTEAPPIDDTPAYTVPLCLEIDGVVQWEYTYSPDGLSFSKTDYTEETPITYTVTFDEAGNPLRTEWTVAVNEERTEAWRDDYYLDESARIVEEKRYCEGEIQNAYSYTYEESGAIATQESRDVQQRNTIYRLLYDEMGTHIATRYDKYNGEYGYYMEEKTFTYDGNGRIVTESSADVFKEYDYLEKDGLLMGKRVINTVGEYTWSYTYSYTYENGCLSREDCSFEGRVTDSRFYTQTEFAHYAEAEKWIFRERLP